MDCYDPEFENDLALFAIRLESQNSQSSEKPKLKPNLSQEWINRVRQENFSL